MAAAAIMENFINERTQGTQKEEMEKNKENLKKYLQKPAPPARDPPTPREIPPPLPTFAGSNKVGFETICNFIKEYNEYTITKVNQNNEDHKNEILRDVALMITGNSNLLVSNLDTTREVRTNFVSSISTASENKTAQEKEFKKITDILTHQGSSNEDSFKKLVPGDNTPGAVNHAEIIKAVEKVHMINESKFQTLIREQTSKINKTIKDSQTSQTGTGNARRTIPPFATQTTSAWGTPANPTPPNLTPDQPSNTPTPTPTSNPNPDQMTSGNGSTRMPNQEVEYITISRPVAAKDPITGNEIIQWTDVQGVKKRNKNFRFTKDAEDAHKQEENKQAAILRAKKQIMIYGLPDPPVADKKTEIGNIRLVADEFGKKWLKEKGFNIQKSDLKNCITQRLWNYGGKNHRGPKPLKVTFDNPEIANKFMIAAKAAGCEGSRSKIKLGKFQNIPEEDPNWPKYYLRPGTTWEDRQRFKAKKEEREAHRASSEYERYKGAKERTQNNTHKIADDDLEGLVFLDPEDTGEDKTEDREQIEMETSTELGSGQGSGSGVAEQQQQEVNAEDVENKSDAEEEDKTEKTDDNSDNANNSVTEIAKKRKSDVMSPRNSLLNEKETKKTNNGASSQTK